MTLPPYWGLDTWGPGYETAATRLLTMTREGPNFRAIVDIIDRLWSERMGILEQIMVAFDLDTAVENQLDIIGEWLGRRREGLSDERYRRALKVQRTSILSSSATSPVLLQIFEEWTGAAPAEYLTSPPAEVRIGGIIAAEDEALLVQFLQQAKPGGVRLGVVGALTAPFINDCAASAVASAGTLDCASNPISGAEVLGSEMYS